MIFKSDFIRNINFFFYKKKHLIIYIVIGFLSLVFELFLRKLIYKHISSNELFLHTSLLCGILFAFYFNIKLNFNVPKIYLKKSLFYFFTISTFSYLFQYYLKNREIIIERARKWNQEHKGAKRLIDERAKLKNNELRWLTVK